MRKHPYFLLWSSLAFLLISLQAFSQSDLKVDLIERSLTPAIVIKGEEMPTYNIEERMAHHNVPGVSIAFFEDSEIKWIRCYGNIVSGIKRAVDTSTLFQAASISKPVAAAGALTLVEQGLIDLDEDINTYLKDWKIEDNGFTKKEKVTLRRLVSHNAGLTVHGFPGYAFADTLPTVVDILNGTRPANTTAILPDTFPGAIWRYSGGGYTVMQKMVEDVTGQPFHEFMQEAVLSKAGMENSTYEQPLNKNLVLSAARAHDGEGKMVMGNWHTYPEMAAAGLWTTPSDLAHFAIAIQAAWFGKSDSLLSQEMAKAMLSEQFENWGLGPVLRTGGDTLAFSHGGSNNGFRCQLFAFVKPITQGVAIMTNGDNGGNLAGEILRAISKIYDWDVYKPTYKSVINIPPLDLENYVGTYSFDEGFEIELRIMDGHLQAKQLGNEQENRIIPESRMLFFDENDGTPFKFTLNGIGNILSLEVAGQYIGEKTE